MRSRWEALHAGLMRSIEGTKAVHAFKNLQLRLPLFSSFDRPIDLIVHLAHDRDLGTRDRFLRPLVSAAKDRQTRPIALSLLLLVLWPGLDSMFRRRLRLFCAGGQDLATEIVDQFTVAVHSLDLGRVGCLTATLIRNTERRVLDDRTPEMIQPGRPTHVPPPETTGHHHQQPAVSPFGLPDALSTAGSVGAIHGWLHRTVGADADLIIQAVLLDRGGRELA